MEKTAFTLKQWVCLLISSLTLVGHFILVKAELEISGRDSWLSVLVSIPVGCFIGGMVLFIRSRINQRDEFHNKDTLSKKIIMIVFVFYFLIAAIAALVNLQQFIVTVFLPETPKWAIGLAFIFLVVFSIHKSLRSVGNLAVLFVCLSFITGSGMSLGLMEMKQYSQILPVLADGWTSVWLGGILYLSMWTELTAFLFIPVTLGSTKKGVYGIFTVILFVSILSIVSLISIIALFDYPLVEKLDYPMHNAVKMARFGFFQRVDIYSMYVMTVSSFLRIYLLQLAACQALSRLLILQSYKKFVIPVSVMTYIGSILWFWDNQVYERFTKVFYGYGFLLLIFALVLAYHKKSKPN
ncbi:GerAB/ArcD/ProY family transporter [Paenibacillus oralis]|uniref:GerAB/ArcD/ProY family transporter n=1 Tax=Paenibacillus oralis TaxID=2490856 RepID=UPI0015ADF375|nr:GerAB/ArcD/ProY family transporter [Paenibacillus oralis]